MLASCRSGRLRQATKSTSSVGGPVGLDAYGREDVHAVGTSDFSAWSWREPGTPAGLSSLPLDYLSEVVDMSTRDREATELQRRVGGTFHRRATRNARFQGMSRPDQVVLDVNRRKPTRWVAGQQAGCRTNTWCLWLSCVKPGGAELTSTTSTRLR